MSYIAVLLSGSFSALASVLLRLAGKMPADHGAFILDFAARPLLYRFGAVCAYGAGFVLYAVALRRIELSVAYPLMVAVTILEITLFGVALGEGTSLRTLSGVALLLVSVLLLFSPDRASA